MSMSVPGSGLASASMGVTHPASASVPGGVLQPAWRRSGALAPARGLQVGVSETRKGSGLAPRKGYLTVVQSLTIQHVKAYYVKEMEAVGLATKELQS